MVQVLFINACGLVLSNEVFDFYIIVIHNRLLSLFAYCTQQIRRPRSTKDDDVGRVAAHITTWQKMAREQSMIHAIKISKEENTV